jgi:hypothetical protein
VINVLIWTENGIEFKVDQMAPSEAKEFIQLIKEHGVWVDGNMYFLSDVVYHAENKTFEITVK